MSKNIEDIAIQDMIKRHEGYLPYIYIDTEGVYTGGWGHAFHERSTIPHEASVALFNFDYDHACKDYDKLASSYGIELDAVRRAVVIDMIFNLGYFGLCRFGRMIAALKAGDYQEAKVQMLDSVWARQVKGRATELAEMMLTGEYKKSG